MYSQAWLAPVSEVFKQTVRKTRTMSIYSKESHRRNALLHPAQNNALSSITPKSTLNMLWRHRLQCVSFPRPHPFLLFNTMAPPHGTTSHYKWNRRWMVRISNPSKLQVRDDNSIRRKSTYVKIYIIYSSKCVICHDSVYIICFLLRWIVALNFKTKTL